MPSVRLSQVCFSYLNSDRVLGQVCLELEVGWSALVGENGGGKSTLLRLIAGELEPSSGELTRQPHGLMLALCRQRVDRRGPEIDALGEAWDRAAVRWRDRLRLEPETLARWGTLSPGERKRWQIGAALWAEPDVLLLDEPTNHLDTEARRSIRRALSRYHGVGVVVSHDRELLDSLTNATVRLASGEAVCYPGSYSTARSLWEQEARDQRSAQAEASRRRKMVARRLGDERRRRASVASKLGARSRIKGPRDSDARSSAVKGRVRNAEARASRKVAVLRGAVQRADAALARHAVVRQRAGRLFVDYLAAPKRRLISLHCAELRAGTQLLARDLHLLIERDSRVLLSGPNGSGKSTLIAALLQETAIPARRLLYLPQEFTDQESEAVLFELRQLPATERGKVLQVVAALGVDPARLLASACPSPGELRKLAMAIGLGRQVWLAILDEPTNHLDLPSIERLELALSAYPGALVLVSHDRCFAEKVAGSGCVEIPLGQERLVEA